MIREQTNAGPVLIAFTEVIHTGWPRNIQQLPEPLKRYWCFRDELTTEGGIILKSHRIVILGTLQKEILSKLHAPHIGPEKTKLRARTSIYWRGLYKDIEETTKAWSTCEEMLRRQQKVKSASFPQKYHLELGQQLVRII